MPSLIYQLSTPLSHGNVQYQHINIFRIDMETKRNNALNEPHLSLYMAACDASGTEIKSYNEHGNEVAVGSCFTRLAMPQVTEAQKQAHRALMQALFDYLQQSGFLAPGQQIEVSA
jgi:hypothetical protein